MVMKINKKNLTQAVILGLLLAVPLGAQAGEIYDKYMVGSLGPFDDHLFKEGETYNGLLSTVDDPVGTYGAEKYCDKNTSTYILKFNFDSDPNSKDTIGDKDNHVYQAINLDYISRVCYDRESPTKINMDLGKLGAIYGDTYGIASTTGFVKANITLGNPVDDVEDHCLIDVGTFIRGGMGAGIAIGSTKKCNRYR